MNADQLNGTQVKTILAAKEPSIYDPALKTIAASWVDWHMAKYECDVDHALEAGAEILERMSASMKEVLMTSHFYEPVKLFMEEAIQGIENYLRAIRLLKDLGIRGWTALMKPNDPSVFTMDQEKSQKVRDWLMEFCKEREIDLAYMAPVANAIVSTSVDVKPEELEKHVPAEPLLESSIKGLPTMAWVLRYVADHKVRPQEAHRKGEEAIKAQHKNGFKA